MGGERERLVLVTAFSQLRAGDLVVVKPCPNCKSAHRAILSGAKTGPTEFRSGTVHQLGLGWVMSPRPKCMRPRPEPVTLQKQDVDSRYVYRVDTGLSHTTETEKELEVSRG